MPKSPVAALVLLVGLVGLAAGPLLAAEVACAPLGKEPGKLGVIVLAGKNTFGSSRRGGGQGATDFLASLKSAIRGAGFRVAAPEMPWTRDRVYNRTYEEALDEIARVAAELKGQGAERIVVIGHSLGANAVLGYGALKGGVAGVVAIAPGHNPDMPRFAEKVQASVAKARAMVADGKGSEQASFDDVNSGNRSGTVATTAARYLSFFDPNGHAVISRNAAAMAPGTALLWIVAEDDPLSKLGPGYAFDKAPPQPLNRYLVVPGDHLQAPDAATSAVIAWLKCL